MTFADDFNYRLALGTKYKDEKTLTYDPQIGRFIAVMKEID